MKKSAMFVLAAGVLVAGCSSEPPEPRSPRAAYESGWVAIRDGKVKEGLDSGEASVSCAALVDPPESKDLQDALRQGCTDRVLMRGNKADEFSDAEPAGTGESATESPEPVRTVQQQNCGWLAPPPVFVQGPPEYDRYGNQIAGSGGHFQEQPKQWVCR